MKKISFFDFLIDGTPSMPGYDVCSIQLSIFNTQYIFTLHFSKITKKKSPKYSIFPRFSSVFLPLMNQYSTCPITTRK